LDETDVSNQVSHPALFTINENSSDIPIQNAFGIFMYGPSHINLGSLFIWINDTIKV